MPHVSGDGGGGNGTEKRPAGLGIERWLGGTAKVMTGGTGSGGYVVLGGTRYGLRVSQVSTYNNIIIIFFFLLFILVYIYKFVFFIPSHFPRLHARTVHPHISGSAPAAAATALSHISQARETHNTHTHTLASRVPLAKYYPNLRDPICANRIFRSLRHAHTSIAICAGCESSRVYKQKPTSFQQSARVNCEYIAKIYIFFLKRAFFRRDNTYYIHSTHSPRSAAISNNIDITSKNI